MIDYYNLNKNMLKLYGDYMSQPFRAVLTLMESESDKVGKFEVKEL